MANLLIIILALVSSFATASENQLAGLAHNDTTRWDFTSPGLPDHRSPRIFHDSFSARYVVGKECYRRDAPCIILENNYDFDVAIWGEIRQPLNSSGSPPQSSMAVNEDKWMILEPGWAALVKGSAEKYMGTVRGFPVCGERKYGVGFGNGVADGDCEGQFEETATRFEWTQLDPEQMGRANWRANMNIIDGYNLGITALLHGYRNQKLTVYIPPASLRAVCPPAQLSGGGEHLACRSDCGFTGLGVECTNSSSTFFKPWANQAVTWPHDDGKYKQVAVDRFVRVIFGKSTLESMI